MTSLFFDEGTKVSMFCVLLDSRSGGEECSEENLGTAFWQLLSERKFSASAEEMEQSGLPRKASKIMNRETVPKTDTGGRGE